MFLTQRHYEKSREKYKMEDESDGEEIEITAAEVVEKLEEVSIVCKNKGEFHFLFFRLLF